MYLTTKYDPIQTIKAYNKIIEDGHRAKLYFLYKKLNFIIEHLLIINGCVMDENFEYDKSLFQKSYISWLNDERTQILKKIKDFQEITNLDD